MRSQKKILKSLPKGAEELEGCHLRGRHIEDRSGEGLERQRERESRDRTFSVHE